MLILCSIICAYFGFVLKIKQNKIKKNRKSNIDISYRNRFRTKIQLHWLPSYPLVPSSSSLHCLTPSMKFCLVHIFVIALF